MRQNQQNIRTMFQTTVDFLDANNSVWSGMAAFADAVNRVKAGLADLDTAVDAQKKPGTGVTQDKADLRDDLESQVLRIANQLSALAFKTGDNDLATQVEVSKPSLDKMTDDDLELVAERVRDLANAHIAELAAYGITAADVTALEDARAAFQAVITAPRRAAVNRRAHTESLPQLIANVRSIFRNELDKMVIAFQPSNPAFYNGYFAARVIVDRAATRPSATAPTPPVQPTSPPGTQPV